MTPDGSPEQPGALAQAAAGDDLPDAPLGVVGAGTMGAGIAQVAAGGGLDVKLFDVAPDAANKAAGRIGDALHRAAERGRVTQQQVSATLNRIEPVGSIGELRDCFIVIEAAPEKIDLKRELFATLASICGPETVLATNTSSIPVTSVASGIEKPERVVGMHFFNPVPAMRLVEIIAGLNSGEHAIRVAHKVAKAMGKEAIDASDGPGFLVNRCSRPFLLEAQRLLAEQVATHDQIDRVVRLGGGFRMGPFELSDLVGIDVGYDIARSFFNLGFNEPRWQPSGIPARMIAAGRLGRKSRRGYYTYHAGHEYREPDPPAMIPENAEGSVEILGDGATAEQLRRLCQAAGYTVLPLPGQPSQPRSLIVDARLEGAGEGHSWSGATVIVLCAGTSLANAARGSDIVGFHCLPPLGESHIVELTRGSGTTDESANRAVRFFHTIGKHVEWVGDAPGLVLGRIVCQLINEAAFAAMEGVGTPADIDKGVRLGLNYPRGVLEWADIIGVDHVLATIDALQREIGGDRYRAAPLLRRMVAEGRTGRLAGKGFLPSNF